MPINFKQSSATHQTNQSISQAYSISNIPKDQMAALVSNLANATIANTVAPHRSAVVEKNFQDLQKRLAFLSNKISFKLYDQNQINYQELNLRIKAPEVNNNLPIFFREDIIDTIDLSASLPPTLQKLKSCATVLDFLKISFPKLISSSFFDKETKITRFIVSSPIPLNQEGKGNFFPQIESERAKIAYIAWDSSGSQIAKGFKEKTCDILFGNKEAFCGVILSQENFKGIEKGAGASAYFMTSKVTVIGILIEPPKSIQPSWCVFDGIITDNINIACDGNSNEDNLYSLRTSHTTFGMLGVKGEEVLASSSLDLPDRPKKFGEILYPFCIEIVPQFSSEKTPVCKEDLEMALEVQFQEKIFAQFEKLNFK